VVGTHRPHTTAVVLGCAQRATEEDRQRAAAAGVDLLIRPTGAGAVQVGPWSLGANIALAPGDPLAALPLSDSYRWLGLLFVQWLATAGIAARSYPLSHAARASRPWACFAGFS